MRLPLYICNSIVIDSRFGYSVYTDRYICEDREEKEIQACV